MYLPRLDPDPGAPFPPAESARRQPDGLLAFGGDLSPMRLMNAYRHGIFPWFSEGDPILWWSPDPRTVFDTSGLHLSRRFRRQMRACTWTIRVDEDFDAVISACAETPRHDQNGTWILPPMQAAYSELHRLGHAHCVAVFDGTRLAGGIYGVHVGTVFCGESMVSLDSGGSKVALAALCRLLASHGVRWLDAQMHTPHLASLGAMQMPRHAYLEALAEQDPGHLPQASWNGLLAGVRACDIA